jgi:hypothetical protein
VERRPPGRHQGAHRPGRGAAGGYRVVGRPAAGSPSTRHPRPRTGRRRQSDGLWNVWAEVFTASRRQRCWGHKARNVTNALPTAALQVRSSNRRDHACWVR